MLSARRTESYTVGSAAQVAEGTGAVNHRIGDVQRAAQETGEASGALLHAANDLTGHAATLRLARDLRSGQVFLNNISLGIYPAILRTREDVYARWGRRRVAAEEDDGMVIPLFHLLLPILLSLLRRAGVGQRQGKAVQDAAR